MVDLRPHRTPKPSKKVTFAVLEDKTVAKVANRPVSKKKLVVVKKIVRKAPKKKVVKKVAVQKKALPKARKVLTAATAVAALLSSDNDSDNVAKALRSATASEGVASLSCTTELNPPPTQRQL